MSDEPARQPQEQGLEQRLQRLEDTLAQLQDSQQLEDRIVDRLSRRLQPAPGSVEFVAAGTRFPGAAPQHVLVPGPPISSPGHPQSDPNSSSEWARPHWMFDMIAEARAAVRMYVDPRYNISWLARLMPLALLLAFFTSQIWIPGIHFMPDWLAIVVSKIVDLLLAYLLFRIVSREARRYRETAPDLPASLRL
jgi:hypothetical protein